jgi:lysophospholipase L1-like esterase
MRLPASALALVVAVGVAVAGCGASPTGHVQPAYQRYVALGDSFTAAPRAGTPKGPPICNQTGGNYPSLVASAVGVAAFVDRSCTGATTADLTEAQHDGIEPQLDAVRSDTDLVTIGLGANDENLLASVLLGCSALARTDPHGAPCRAKLGSPSQVAALVGPVRRHLLTAVREVRDRAARARIVLVGYPQIVPARGTCPELPLATGDYAFVRGVLARLDDSLRAAAAGASVPYVDVWRASAGHDICGRDPWVNGAANDPAQPPPFHPFEEEQQEVARLVERALDGASPSGPASGS